MAQMEVTKEGHLRIKAWSKRFKVKLQFTDAIQTDYSATRSGLVAQITQQHLKL